MARTINDIQQNIIDGLKAERPGLSPSMAAEWRLWTWVVATAIHLFEVILDSFRKEMDAVADRHAPGTIRWLADQCRRFQNGHELLFDEDTAQLYYAVDDPAARIIDVVAVSEGSGYVTVKVAKLDDGNRIVPLSPDELLNFTGYLGSVGFAGTGIVIVSTTADRVRYQMEVFYKRAVPVAVVRKRVMAALDAFRTARDFDTKFYQQRFISTVLEVKGVVTADLKIIERKGTSMENFEAMGIVTELEAGYFDYADDCTLTLTPVKQS